MKRIARRLGLLACAMFLALVAAGPAPVQAASGNQPPVLAYYYIWYDHTSWSHGKSDYSALGRYSSDDVTVMQRQIELAKGAGIDGFIVSWKNTPALDARLAKLVKVAKSANFKLELIYEGLNYYRQPLPTATVGADLKWFAAHYAGNPVFNLFGKPMVIWSGTWMFPAGDIERAAAPVRDKLLVLASEKSTDGYERVASSVDGNAYYWSSVNPSTYPSYGAKLRDMASAVHARHGLWIAPFAPGFDARLVGGHDVVLRNGGSTLRTEYNTAISSSPDALGLISWNEFSENSEVEPSHNYGTVALRTLRQMTHALGPSAAELQIDSSDSAGSGGPGNIALPILLVVVVMLGAVAVAARIRGSHSSNLDEPPPPPVRRPRDPDSRRWQWPKLVLVLVIALVPAGATPIASVVGGASPTTAADAPPPPVYMGHKPPLGASTVTVAAAGDIACTKGDPDAANAPIYKNDVCKQRETAGLLAGIRPDAVLVLGDNDYPSGSYKGFEQVYNPTWGQFKAITYPVPGNHEYGTPGAGGYFGYFGAAAGKPGQGWYSYDLGKWHIVAINSECERIGGCRAGSPEERWLRADLAAHPAACTLAYWHKPRWSSGSHGSNTDYSAFWQDLYAAGADLVLVGHDHDYERFAPLNPAGRVDPARGIREIVVGTGGDSHYLIHEPETGSQRRLQGVYGVLALTLQPHGYSWKFDAVSGKGILDSGYAACH